MVQKTLEDIYEKSFELLESKIKEQSVEIENLLTHLKTTKEQISLRDTELSRYKTEIEVILIISARNLSDY
jgi:NOL1/NOP2/fmu family ribosome biogenesis protein